MTPEQKAAAAVKRAQTYEAKRQREAKKKEDRSRTITALTEIRDDPSADPATRLKAIELLRELHALVM